MVQEDKVINISNPITQKLLKQNNLPAAFPLVVLNNCHRLASQGWIQPSFHLTVKTVHVNQCNKSVRHITHRLS